LELLNHLKQSSIVQELLEAVDVVYSNDEQASTFLILIGIELGGAGLCFWRSFILILGAHRQLKASEGCVPARCLVFAASAFVVVVLSVYFSLKKLVLLLEFVKLHTLVFEIHRHTLLLKFNLLCDLLDFSLLDLISKFLGAFDRFKLVLNVGLEVEVGFKLPHDGLLIFEIEVQSIQHEQKRLVIQLLEVSFVLSLLNLADEIILQVD
jgi:hypothetical protein